jgi:hypothetical protein
MGSRTEDTEGRKDTGISEPVWYAVLSPDATCESSDAKTESRRHPPRPKTSVSFRSPPCPPCDSPSSDIGHHVNGIRRLIARRSPQNLRVLPFPSVSSVRLSPPAKLVIP